MREELVKVVYKKSRLEIREKRARIVACCCKDVEALIAEAEGEISKEREIKKRLRRGVTLNLDAKLGREDQLKLDALQTLKPMGTVRREMKKMASQIVIMDPDQGSGELVAYAQKELDAGLESPSLREFEDSSKSCKYNKYIYIYI